MKEVTRHVLCLLVVVTGVVACDKDKFRLRFYPTGVNCSGAVPKWDAVAQAGECFALAGEETSRRWMLVVPDSRKPHKVEGRSWAGQTCEGNAYDVYPMTVDSCNDDGGWGRLLTRETPVVPEYQLEIFARPKCQGRSMVWKITEGVCERGGSMPAAGGITNVRVLPGSCEDYVRAKFWLGIAKRTCSDALPVFLEQSLELGSCQSLTLLSSTRIVRLNH